MALTPREVTRATNINVLSTSIVNPSVFLSLAATVNGNTVVFLVDTGSALTILRRIYGRDAKDQSSDLNLGVRRDWLVWRAVFCKFLDQPQWQLIFMVRYCRLL